MHRYLSPSRYVYALFERVRFGKWRLVPRGVYQRIALTINRVAFRKEIAAAQARYQAHCSAPNRAEVASGLTLVDGHHSSHARDIPGGQEALEVCRRLAAERGNTKDERFNPYSLAGKQELLELPEVRNFLYSEPLIDLACEYLGTYPQITSVDLLESRPREGGPQASQNYHLDNIAERVVRLVLHVSDVGTTNGPFTYYPESVSDRLGRKVRYQWRLDHPEVSLEELEQAADEAVPLQATGEHGSILLVDTCRCFHYGSRVEVGLRHVLMATYAALPLTNVRWMAGLR